MKRAHHRLLRLAGDVLQRRAPDQQLPGACLLEQGRQAHLRPPRLSLRGDPSLMASIRPARHGSWAAHEFVLQGSSKGSAQNNCCAGWRAKTQRHGGVAEPRCYWWQRRSRRRRMATVCSRQTVQPLLRGPLSSNSVDSLVLHGAHPCPRSARSAIHVQSRAQRCSVDATEVGTSRGRRTSRRRTAGIEEAPLPGLLP